MNYDIEVYFDSALDIRKKIYEFAKIVVMDMLDNRC